MNTGTPLDYGDNRVFGLDVLRAMAVLFVVYGHGYYLITGDVPWDLYRVPIFDGVTMFFVLSGFLIGRILLRTMAKDDFDGSMLVGFWIRRWFRTLPNYFAVLIFLVIAFELLGKPRPEDLVRYFFFAQNIASPHPEFFPEAWSLTVEEWFYLLVPIPMYLSTKLRNADRRRLMLFWIAVVIVAITAFRLYRVLRFGYSTVDEWESALRKQVVTRMDSLMFGVLGAYLSLYETRLWRRASGVAFVAGILLLLVDKSFVYVENILYLNYFKLTVAAVGTLLLLPKLSSWRVHRAGLLVRAFTFVSVVSYSMYLLHLTAVQEVILPTTLRLLSHVCWRCSQSHPLQYALYWAVTVVGSFLLYRHFERPVTMLRETLRPSGRAVVSAFAAPAARTVERPGD